MQCEIEESERQKDSVPPLNLEAKTNIFHWICPSLGTGQAEYHESPFQYDWSGSRFIRKFNRDLRFTKTDGFKVSKGVHKS